MFGRTDGGYYDSNGRWVRTKFCFVYCGASCTCSPPFGHYAEQFDQSKDDDERRKVKDRESATT